MARWVAAEHLHTFRLRARSFSAVVLRLASAGLRRFLMAVQLPRPQTSMPSSSASVSSAVLQA